MWIGLRIYTLIKKGNEMSRVDDLRDTCEESYSCNVSLARMNTYMFIDIAKSLAVIADEISGEDSQDSQEDVLGDFIGYLASKLKEEFEYGFCDCHVDELIRFIREHADTWEQDK